MFKIREINNNYIVGFKRAQRLNTIISDLVKTQLLKLIKKSGTTLILDFQGIHFIDSHGFDTLIKITEVAKENSNAFYLYNVSSDVMELINLMELQSHFRFCGRKLVESLNLIEIYK